ncbi:HD domain-containing phosphohydrolase [Syntrophus aciditrophicus]|uniref:Response regulator with GAF and HD domains n=1 Tax=Syntrophus aciditrophicus (strain SB) TaxID=56780 RepID=Q2LT34_SYNAS|nr:HD domain-containing phosphohydrolase [Syntrophus aciditrophicus]ABC77248.1 response regulator with GAF and HD domains [Syntrophus aciditrophicus SB]
MMERALKIENYSTDQKRILIVDDYPQLRTVVKEALEREGNYEVNEAENGLEALKLLQNADYDMIISDVMMPGMGGIDLLKSIKEVRSNAVTIMITAYPAVETTVSAIKKGAIDFIKKPFDIDELLFKVNLYLRKKQTVSNRESEKDIKHFFLGDEPDELLLYNYIYDAIENSFGDNNFIFENVVELAMQIVGGKDCALLLYEEDEQQFHPQIISGIDPETYNLKILPHISDIFKEVADAKGAVVVHSDENPGVSPSLICAPLMIRNKVFGILSIRKKGRGERFSKKELNYILILTKRSSLNVENKILYESLYRSLLDTFKSLVASIQVRDSYTEEHSCRVTELAVNVARSMGCTSEDIESIRIAGMLHDIGKIAIPDRILLKPDKLMDYEYQVIKSHPGIGERILKPVMLLEKERKIILHHHERYDGKGYPNGLSGENIPFLSRLLAIADSYDAMTNNRPYRYAMPIDDAIGELRKNSNQQFDGHIVECFLQNI